MTLDQPDSLSEQTPVIRIADLPGPGVPVAACVLGEAVYFATAPTRVYEAGRILRVDLDDVGEVAIVHEGAVGTAVTGFAALTPAGAERPVLFAATADPDGGRILRSGDGRTFEPVTEPGLGEDRRVWLGPIAAWGERLVVAAGSAAPIDPAARGAELLAGTGEPGAAWSALAAPGFGDPENGAISALLAMGDELVAGTANHLRGFQLWEAGADGVFARGLHDGAHRYSLNPVLSALAASEGELLLGTAAPPPPAEEDGQAAAIGVIAPELLAYSGDGAWDLIAGQPRFTPDGFKVPFAVMGPGFGVRETAAVICLHAPGAGRIAAVTTAAAPGDDLPFGLLGAGESRLWWSEDNGETFTGQSAPGPVLAAAPAPDGDICLAVQDGASCALYRWRPF